MGWCFICQQKICQRLNVVAIPTNLFDSVCATCALSAHVDIYFKGWVSIKAFFGIHFLRSWDTLALQPGFLTVWGSRAFPVGKNLIVVFLIIKSDCCCRLKGILTSYSKWWLIIIWWSRSFLEAWINMCYSYKINK